MSRLLAVSSVTVVYSAWPREGPDEERLALFIDLYSSDGPHALPAIEVIGPDSEGKYLIADGHHRTFAAIRVGLKEIPAEILPLSGDADPVRAAHRRGLETARASSKPLTLNERRRAGWRVLKEEPALPDREIARLTGLSHQTIGRLREQLAAGRTEPRDPIEYTPMESADDLARRLVNGLSKVWEARGLSDYIVGDKTGKRLAVALRHHHGNKAPEWAGRIRRWADIALAELERQ
jgi:ParB-like chromosome segregation protein Spo0J